ncbi:MAG: 50S ribosomal protein L3 [Pseudomonadota bacterium]|nr:50S ribosomal protein L3 [Pseudomonadota bacterium]
MSLGLIGIKQGMTRIFEDSGTSVPVTVISINGNFISRLKTIETDGYNAVQIAYGEQLTSRLERPIIGELKKAKLATAKGFKEFRVAETILSDLEIGKELRVDIFSEGQFVDTSGVTIGKGFAGTVKRHNFSMQDATHGNSLSHRVAGSIGQCQTPGRVFKGKKMAGQMGNKKRTMQKLEIIKIDKEKNVILLKGATPGAKGSLIEITSSVKANRKE